jgi:hypothetical protein
MCLQGISFGAIGVLFEASCRLSSSEACFGRWHLGLVDMDELRASMESVILSEILSANALVGSIFKVTLNFILNGLAKYKVFSPLNVGLNFECDMQQKWEYPLQMWMYIVMRFKCQSQFLSLARTKM